MTMDSDVSEKRPFQQAPIQKVMTVQDIFPKEGPGLIHSKPESKILIVDDEKFNCDIVEGFLQVLGMNNVKKRAEQCYDGDQAVERVETAIQEGEPLRYGLILMDCNMPNMDGYEATKTMRNMW